MRTSILFVPVVLCIGTAQAQQVSDTVEIDYQGVWYPGKVLKVEGEKYFITYDGWDESWDEWVGKERLRAIKPGEPPPPPPPPPPPKRKYSVGDRVEIQFGFNTANATVMAITETGYELKVDGMSTIPYTEDMIIRKLDQ